MKFLIYIHLVLGCLLIFNGSECQMLNSKTNQTQLGISKISQSTKSSIEIFQNSTQELVYLINNLPVIGISYDQSTASKIIVEKLKNGKVNSKIWQNCRVQTICNDLETIYGLKFNLANDLKSKVISTFEIKQMNSLEALDWFLRSNSAISVIEKGVIVIYLGFRC